MAGDPDLLRRLEQAVAKLPRRQRKIFLAHRLDGLSYGEIAERTGLSARRVERCVVRALRKIDRQLCGERVRWWERWF
jgi:RNA polymerase sigma factor (sigma-70 family)